MFADREDAARRLARALEAYRGQRPLVLAIPRGAVPMGALVARELGGDLDVVLVRKLGAPHSPEFAVGAVDETGWTYVAPHARLAGADQDYLDREREEQLRVMKRRRASYTPQRAPIDPRGRVAIVVDDGLATGATMVAALHAVRARAPSRLVCAVPVGAADSVELVREHADEVVCLHAPPGFGSVGYYYRDFRQVDDDEVVRVLRDAAAPSKTERTQ